MGQFVVSARKYRPQAFTEVLGQNHVAKTLTNAIQNDHLAHAFLFCGPRGVGKTTCARILAKVLNCQNPTEGIKPCNECSSCTSFNNNASFNIIELDAASNNSVEHIRNLIEQVRFQPQQGTHKIFIIDEVHMLSTQAFNAFLKTLEEPPEYAIFILATTEKHKILPTILSRCQVFDFKRIRIAEIVAQLKNICSEESIKAEEEALMVIAEKADGSMRDGLSIFDKIASSANANITYNGVIENLNILDYEYYFKFSESFLVQDIDEVFLLLEEIIDKGFDIDLCIQGLANHLRTILVAQKEKTKKLIQGSESLVNRYLAHASNFEQSFLLNGLSILNKCEINFQKANNKRLHFEIALSKICYLKFLTHNSIEKKTKLGIELKNQSSDKTRILLDATPVNTMLSEKEEQKKSISDTASFKKEVDSHSTKAKEKNESTNAASKKLSPISIGFSSVDDLKDQIIQEAKKTDNRPKELDLDIIENIWKEHQESHGSPSVKTAMKIKKIAIDRHSIIIYVPSPGICNTINQETLLVDNIRERFAINNLEFSVKVNTELFPGYQKFEPKKILNKKEKYEILKIQNPYLETFKEDLMLKVTKD